MSHPQLSAQCPACGLHELVAHRLAPTGDGRWQFVDDDRARGTTVEIDACPVCYGAWFDRGELDRLAAQPIEIEAALDPKPGDSRRRCPRGHGSLRLRHLPHRVDTPIDRCPACGGLWLDGNERRRLARATTREGQRTRGQRVLRRTAIWLAQILMQVPVEVENPARGRPWVVMGLLITLLVVFVSQIQGAFDATQYGLIGTQIVNGHGLQTLITHQFLHGSWVHLLGNAYFLYTFGDNIEHIFGGLRFLLFFLLAGVVGGLAHVLLGTASDLPLIGASGAIAGVLGAYLLTFPRRKVFHVLVFIPLKLSVWVYVVAWITFHFLMALYHFNDQVAWFAHIGGFAAGLVATPTLHRLRRRLIAGRVDVAQPH